MIGLVLTAHTHDPERLMQSIKESEEAVRWYIFLHKDNKYLEEKLRIFADENDVRLYIYKINRGLARSWNEGIHQSISDGCEFTIVLNDDLHFTKGGFDSFVSSLRTEENWCLGFINGLEIGGSLAGQSIVQGMACFAISKRCVDKIGYFDETFSPAYYEDVDYLRRMRLAKCKQIVADGVLGEHLRSTTIEKNPDLHDTMGEWHKLNAEYYERKWGPLNGEIYETPFGDKIFDLSIAWEDRIKPYCTRGRQTV